MNTHGPAFIRNTVAVVSGKGGVGKSTVSVMLASSLSDRGYRVGLLDTDLHGPSIPVMLGIEEKKLMRDDLGIIPFDTGKLKVVSIGCMLENPDDAVIWRGPLKHQLITEFLTEVQWGPLDYLVIDVPPGTGDEPLTVMQMCSDLDGVFVVTTAQRTSAADVRRCITFCRKLQVPILGLIENMNGIICPSCGKAFQVFPEGAGMHISRDMGVDLLGSIPMDPVLAASCDRGCSTILDAPSYRELVKITDLAERIFLGDKEEKQHENSRTGNER